MICKVLSCMLAILKPVRIAPDLYIPSDTYLIGHYVSYSRVGSQWFKFNDHNVTLASKSQVLNEQAFLLFYVVQSLA